MNRLPAAFSHARPCEVFSGVLSECTWLSRMADTTQGSFRMARKSRTQAPVRGTRNFAELKAEIDRLVRELAKAEQKIRELEQGGADPMVARRLSELEEGQKIARGLAVDAAAAKARAEAELRALRRQIDEAPGIYGWLLRRLKKRPQG